MVTSFWGRIRHLKLTRSNIADVHRKLDEAVFAAYGWSSEISNDELLAKLLALNLERAAKQM